MSIICIAMLPLMVLEYYYTKERVTEELGKTETVKVPYVMQIKAVFTDKYMALLLVSICQRSSCLKRHGGDCGVEPFCLSHPYILDNV